MLLNILGKKIQSKNPQNTYKIKSLNIRTISIFLKIGNLKAALPCIKLLALENQSFTIWINRRNKIKLQLMLSTEGNGAARIMPQPYSP